MAAKARTGIAEAFHELARSFYSPSPGFGPREVILNGEADWA